MNALGLVGAGQFAGQFAKLFRLHPDVGDIYVTDLLPDRATDLAAFEGLAGTASSFEALLHSDVDADGIFTQRWTHGPLVCGVAGRQARLLGGADGVDLNEIEAISPP